jgi:hypothetical protein
MEAREVAEPSIAGPIFFDNIQACVDAIAVGAPSPTVAQEAWARRYRTGRCPVVPRHPAHGVAFGHA